MTSQADLMAEMSDLRAANLQLQSTINGLRAELEKGAASIDAAVQAARAELTEEMLQLRLTVGMMRDQLEAEADVVISAMAD